MIGGPGCQGDAMRRHILAAGTSLLVITAATSAQEAEPAEDVDDELGIGIVVVLRAREFGGALHQELELPVVEGILL